MSENPFDPTSALGKAWQASKVLKEQGETRQVLNPLQRSALKPKSLRLAITAKCFDCQGGHADPGIRQRIRDCPIETCPLYALRPHQGRKEPSALDLSSRSLGRAGEMAAYDDAAFLPAAEWLSAKD